MYVQNISREMDSIPRHNCTHHFKQIIYVNMCSILDSCIYLENGNIYYLNRIKFYKIIILNFKLIINLKNLKFKIKNF